MTSSDERPRAASWADRLAEAGITRGVLALCLLWIVAIGPLVHEMTAQGAPRLALTGAIVDDHDIKIDGYLVGFDYTERDGHTYSDKAPGQEVLAIPSYVAARAVGADQAIVRRVHENLTLWWLTFTTSGLPAVAITLLVASAMHRRGSPIPLPALATLTFGTMLLPFAANLYGHVLGAALGYAAWVVLDRAPPSWKRGALAGVLIGLAVLVEYPLALVGVVLAGLLAVRRHWSSLAGFVAAGVPAAIALGAYQWSAFGSPLSSGYTSKSYHQGATLFITGVPKPTTLAAVLFGTRGLFLFTPVVAVGIYGLVQRWRRTRDDGAMVALVVVGAFLLLQAGWVNAWGGDAPGPRYVIPMLPFLGLGLSESWMAVSPPVRRFVAGISITAMVLPTITFHLVDSGTFLIAGTLQKLFDYGVNPTVWSIALGPVGWVLYAASVAAALWWYLRCAAAERVVDPAPAAADQPVAV